MDDLWIVTTAAATVATAISTSVALWLRQRDKPEAAWEVTRRSAVQSDLHGTGERVNLANAGDGAAYQVQVTGRGCFVERVDAQGLSVEEPLDSVVHPGDFLRLRVYHDGTPLKARLRVAWVPAPTRVNRTVIEVIPLVEAAQLAATGRKTGPSEWRYRELPWWRLLQRRRQWASRRSRERARARTARELQAMRQWQQQAWRQSPQSSAGDKP